MSNNRISNNDHGIGVGGQSGSGCCSINSNKLKDNRFFGIVIADSEHTISNV
jgi:parallel beta-helix repeat protein